MAVVEEGQFALGARRLGASISTVSQQITNLEAALGARLIVRAARPMALTPAGYAFQRRALAILDETTRAQSELAELELSALPQLRLAMIDDFDAEIAPALVQHLVGQLPGCNVIAHARPSHENLAGLEAREIDIAVAADIDAPADWSERHPLLRDPYILVTCGGLTDAASDIIGQLMTVPMVRFASTQLMGRQIEAHLHRLRLVPRRCCEFESSRAVLAGVAGLQGWTIITASAFMSAPRLHGRLEARPLPFPGFSRTVALHARRGVLGGLPTRTADILRTLLERLCLAPALREMPWLASSLRILNEFKPEAAIPRSGQQ